MITSNQIRAARALLRWSAETLANKAGISLNTIQRMESAEDEPGGLARNVGAVERALTNAGVIFEPGGAEGPGVRLTKTRQFLNGVSAIAARDVSMQQRRTMVDELFSNYVRELRQYYDGDPEARDKERSYVARLGDALFLADDDDPTVVEAKLLDHAAKVIRAHRPIPKGQPAER